MASFFGTSVRHSAPSTAPSTSANPIPVMGSVAAPRYFHDLPGPQVASRTLDSKLDSKEGNTHNPAGRDSAAERRIDERPIQQAVQFIAPVARSTDGLQQRTPAHRLDHLEEASVPYDRSMKYLQLLRSSVSATASSIASPVVPPSAFSTSHSAAEASRAALPRAGGDAESELSTVIKQMMDAVNNLRSPAAGSPTTGIGHLGPASPSQRSVGVNKSPARPPVARSHAFKPNVDPLSAPGGSASKRQPWPTQLRASKPPASLTTLQRSIGSRADAATVSPSASTRVRAAQASVSTIAPVGQHRSLRSPGNGSVVTTDGGVVPPLPPNADFAVHASPNRSFESLRAWDRRPSLSESIPGDQGSDTRDQGVSERASTEHSTVPPVLPPSSFTRTLVNTILHSATSSSSSSTTTIDRSAAEQLASPAGASSTVSVSPRAARLVNQVLSTTAAGRSFPSSADVGVVTQRTDSMVNASLSSETSTHRSAHSHRLVAGVMNSSTSQAAVASTGMPSTSVSRPEPVDTVQSRDAPLLSNQRARDMVSQLMAASSTIGVSSTLAPSRPRLAGSSSTVEPSSEVDGTPSGMVDDDLLSAKILGLFDDASRGRVGSTTASSDVAQPLETGRERSLQLETLQQLTKSRPLDDLSTSVTSTVATRRGTAADSVNPNSQSSSAHSSAPPSPTWISMSDLRELERAVEEQHNRLVDRGTLGHANNHLSFESVA
jgi:hypothetical protein